MCTKHLRCCAPGETRADFGRFLKYRALFIRWKFPEKMPQFLDRKTLYPRISRIFRWMVPINSAISKFLGKLLKDAYTHSKVPEFFIECKAPTFSLVLNILSRVFTLIASAFLNFCYEIRYDDRKNEGMDGLTRFKRRAKWIFETSFDIILH